MGNPTILIGIGLVMFALIYMFFKLGDKAKENNNHFPLQLLMLFMVLGCFLLIGKVTLDDADHCSWNVVNSTISGATTNYGYEYQCETNTNTTANSFYRVTTWAFYLVSAYVVLYLIYYVFQIFMKWVSDYKGGGNA